jgi:hypothetical protein
MPMNRALDDDDDRTIGPVAVLRGRPDAAFAPSSSAWGHTLPEGTRLGEFEITGLIGEGGFGIVYLARDALLRRRVALKEYMPSSLAGRLTDGSGVAVKSPRHAETFAAGLRSFVNEAQLLAQFDHPSLVKVYRFWEANGTAYMAMPYYEGPTLKAALAQRAEPPGEDEIRQWLDPLLDALDVLHRANCFHRDIAPDNVLLTKSGPLLLDFGAARRVIGDMTHALTVVLKPGYAPIEQYGDVPTMTQGPWTDLYAVAAVVRYAIVGKAPMPSVERLVSDRLEPLARIAAGRCSDRFLRAVDAALAMQPRDRPQSVEQWRALLDAPAATTAAVAPARGGRQPDAARRGRSPPVVGVAIAAAVVPAIAALWWGFTALQRSADTTAPISATPAASAVETPAVPPVQVAAPPAPQSAAPPLAAPPPAPPPTAAAVIEPPTAAAPAAAPRPEPPADAQPAGRSDAPRRSAAARAAPAATPSPARETPARDRPARCTEILQKASLEPLTADEAAYLKRECRS